MSDDFDVVVVGGRCAGAPLAAHLARAGVRVCVLDKARFPSDTASTHIIQPRGTAALDRLGVLEELRAAGAAEIRRITVQYADARLEADFDSPRARTVLSTGNTTGLSVRRHILDAVLLGAAERCGATVRTRTTATGLERDAVGRVVGVRTAAGVVRARVVVGADGRGSFTARAVQAREYGTYRAPRLASWAYFRGALPDRNRLRIGRIGESALIATPADDDLLLVGAVPPVSRARAFLADRDAAFDAEVRRWPELHALVADARREGPMRVIPEWRAHFRQAAGPGWVLTGDAGNFKDPAAAQGITDALRQAETLAGTLRTGLEDGSLDEATRAWWRWRDDDCRDMHWFARDMGAAGTTTPLLAETIRDIAAREPLVLAAVLNRDLPTGAVITPRLVARATVAAVRRRAADVPAVTAEGGRAVATTVRRTASGLHARTLFAASLAGVSRGRSLPAR